MLPCIDVARAKVVMMVTSEQWYEHKESLRYA